MPRSLRRRGPASDAELQRRSFYSVDASSNPTVPDSRASEQIPRRPSAAEFLTTSTGVNGSSVTGTSAESGSESLHRTVSPPIQEENQKHRRFSMLKFRHASDSQLSTRGMSELPGYLNYTCKLLTYFLARLHAQAQAHPVPPVPQRMCCHCLALSPFVRSCA